MCEGHSNVEFGALCGASGFVLTRDAAGTQPSCASESAGDPLESPANPNHSAASPPSRSPPPFTNHIDDELRAEGRDERGRQDSPIGIERAVDASLDFFEHCGPGRDPDAQVSHELGVALDDASVGFSTVASDGSEASSTGARRWASPSKIR